MRMTELASRLGVEISTPRRWCALFEQRGYKFTRDGSNRRIFYEHDVLLVEQFQEYCGSMKLEEALTRLFDGIGGGVVQAQMQSSLAGADLKEVLRSMVQEVDELLSALPHQIYWYGSEVALRQCSERWVASQLRLVNVADVFI
jgi:hypothetical protein